MTILNDMLSGFLGGVSADYVLSGIGAELDIEVSVLNGAEVEDLTGGETFPAFKAVFYVRTTNEGQGSDKESGLRSEITV